MGGKSPRYFLPLPSHFLHEGPDGVLGSRSIKMNENSSIFEDGCLAFVSKLTYKQIITKWWEQYFSRNVQGSKLNPKGSSSQPGSVGTG